MRTLTEYCERVLIKIEGIKSLEEYYEMSSCIERMKNVKIPLFFISAEDDPIIGNKVIPIEHCNENIMIGVTKGGGHLCYFEGTLIPSS